MAKRKSGIRYARAAFELALERGELDRWQSDLSKIAVLGEDADLLALFENPRLHFDDKVRILTERFADINPLALNLVHLLVAKGRLSIIGHIADDFRQLLDDYRGIEQAEVITAVPLDDEDKLRLGERLGVIVGKKVVIKPATDSGLIGGVVARIGGKLIDGSTRSCLEVLKKELSGVGR